MKFTIMSLPYGLGQFAELVPLQLLLHLQWPSVFIFQCAVSWSTNDATSTSPSHAPARTKGPTLT
jgi:hypothetical protein